MCKIEPDLETGSACDREKIALQKDVTQKYVRILKGVYESYKRVVSNALGIKEKFKVEEVCRDQFCADEASEVRIWVGASIFQIAFGL